jgi:ferric-dicitrate binding protein FerR (iron transport regulator)
MTVEMPDGALVRVLGTSFDVQGGVSNRVALFSGSVRVVDGKDSVQLRPGSQTSTGAQGLRIESADSNSVLAWMRPAVHSPYFDFSNADLVQMLPEIAAWYSVRIENPDQLKGAGITGEFSRKTPLPVLIDELRMIEGRYVRIDLRGDTIFIAPLR